MKEIIDICKQLNDWRHVDIYRWFLGSIKWGREKGIIGERKINSLKGATILKLQL